MSTISSLGLYWLIDCIEDFQEHVNKNDFYWQLVAAISAPVIAAKKTDKSVIVMLDDFDVAARLYDSSLGDAHGLVSIFGESMGNRPAAVLMSLPARLERLSPFSQTIHSSG